MNDQEIQRIINTNGGNFRPAEFLPGRNMLKKKMVETFVQFRNWHGISTQITSAYRTSGSHHYGTAIDFLLWSEWRKTQPEAMRMWRTVTTWPWMGVGIYFDWNDGIGFHTDLVTPSQRQRPLRWLRVKGVYYHYQSLADGLFYNREGKCTTIQEQINRYRR